MGNETRWTPGPWALQMAEDCSGRQLDEMVKWVVTADANDLWISTGPTWDAQHDAEALANAHLIAAAPDLYEELEEARHAIQTLIDDGYMVYLDLRSNIDAALAKGRGEQT